MAADIVSLLKAAVALGASDVHLSAGRPPLARVSGELRDLAGWPALTAESCRELVYATLTERQRARLEADLELDASFAVPGGGRFRVNALFQRGQAEAVYRAVPSAVPPAEALGLGPALVGLSRLPRGLVLVTGPTGSGKTTTLACLIDGINASERKHILTIEDPIEFVYPRRKSLVRQREVGLDTQSFEQALRHALREDPDVILVGEMRDRETIALALTAAETGHLCFSTLHTSDCAQSVDRIIDVFPADQQPQVRAQLAGTLKGVVSQMLIPRRDVPGRVAARELLIVTPGVANLIREGKTHQIPTAIETGGALGMYTMDRSLAALSRRGLISVEDAVARAHVAERVAAAAGAPRAGRAAPVEAP